MTSCGQNFLISGMKHLFPLTPRLKSFSGIDNSQFNADVCNAVGTCIAFTSHHVTSNADATLGKVTGGAPNLNPLGEGDEPLNAALMGCSALNAVAVSNGPGRAQSSTAVQCKGFCLCASKNAKRVALAKQWVLDDRHTSPSTLLGNLIDGLGCDGCGFCLHAQDIPCDVGSQVLATDLAAGGALNKRASLGRNPALAGLPLAQQRGRYAQFSGKTGLSTGLGHEVVTEVHGGIISAALNLVNSAARIHGVSKGLKNQPMRIEEIYRARLRMLASEAGTQTALAEKIQKSPSQLAQWINASKDSKTGKPRTLSRAAAREIERKCGKPDGWMDQPIDDSPFNPADFTPVRRADVAFSNGAGQVVYHEDDKPPLVFRSDFLRRLGISPGNAVVVDAVGISNEPKIVDGSVVLVNCGDRDRLDGRFFAFRYDGELLIKRLERIEDVGVLATAENSNFKPKTRIYHASAEEQIEVIGHAVWTGSIL